MTLAARVIACGCRRVKFGKICPYPSSASARRLLQTTSPRACPLLDTCAGRKSHALYNQALAQSRELAALPSTTKQALIPVWQPAWLMMISSSIGACKCGFDNVHKAILQEDGKSEQPGDMPHMCAPGTLAGNQVTLVLVSVLTELTRFLTWPHRVAHCCKNEEIAPTSGDTAEAPQQLTCNHFVKLTESRPTAAMTQSKSNLSPVAVSTQAGKLTSFHVSLLFKSSWAAACWADLSSIGKQTEFAGYLPRTTILLYSLDTRWAHLVR